MTQRTRPTTVHHLMAQAAGFAMSCREFLRWKSSSPTSDSPAQARLRAALSREEDRPLDDKEQKGLRVRRMAVAANGRANPARIPATLSMPVVTTVEEDGEFHRHHARDEVTKERLYDVRPALEEKTVPYYQRAVRRFERWAARAERKGLDKGKPPAHVARAALDVANMAKEQA